eukprot:GHVQ01015632.1.p2 GENE.GHVQ01015632.1~~GHVQ01015632.1.p2  ORF type:complete len:216 (+),score=24.10 GHVQ01015632.1:241-888(+)
MAQCSEKASFLNAEGTEPPTFPVSSPCASGEGGSSLFTGYEACLLHPGHFLQEDSRTPLASLSTTHPPHNEIRDLIWQTPPQPSMPSPWRSYQVSEEAGTYVDKNTKGGTSNSTRDTFVSDSNASLSAGFCRLLTTVLSQILSEVSQMRTELQALKCGISSLKPDLKSEVWPLKPDSASQANSASLVSDSFSQFCGACPRSQNRFSLHWACDRIP